MAIRFQDSPIDNLTLFFLVHIELSGEDRSSSGTTLFQDMGILIS